MSTETPISKLFHLSRFSDHGFNIVILLAYAPLGLALVMFRLLFSIQLILLLAVIPKSLTIRRWILRVNLMILGLMLTTDGHEWIDGDAEVVVANHVSMFDCWLLEMLHPCMMPLSQSGLPFLFNWLLEYRNMGRNIKEVLETLQTKIHDLGYPLLCFPECHVTNGTAGLLKFSNWPFELNVKRYQPVLIRPSSWQFFNKNVTTLGSSFASDFWWMLFTPVTSFHMSFLPCVSKNDTDDALSPDDFGKAIQQEMATRQGVTATAYTDLDVKEYVKLLSRNSRSQQRRHRIDRRTNNSNDVAKVKDVLPQVPVTVIRSDLLVTKSVDATLMNLLNGTLSYEPLTEAEQAEERRLLEDQRETARAQRPPPRSLVVPLTKPRTELSPRTSSPRAKRREFNCLMSDTTLTFHEKKAIMLDNARSNYIAGHPDLRLVVNGGSRT